MTPAWLTASALGPGLANHLWQSTLAAGVAALLVRALRKQSAQLRFRVWLAASLKFLIPFSLLVAVGRALPHPVAAPSAEPALSVAVETIGQPLSSPARRVASMPRDVPAATRHSLLPVALLSAWALGTMAVLLAQWRDSRRVMTTAGQEAGRSHEREIQALERLQRERPQAAHVPLLSAPPMWEPGVVGIVRPRILWPAGLTGHLSDPELDAILAHELAHIQRRDNLTAALHLIVEAIFWFHPLVWWLGSRLMDERERACDENVLYAGAEAEAYAQGILKVCRYCLHVPVATVAGVTGANLKQRVEEIMTARIGRPLTSGRRVLFGAAAVVFVVAPVAVGAVTAGSDLLPVPVRSEGVSAPRPHDELGPASTMQRGVRSAVQQAEAAPHATSQGSPAPLAGSLESMMAMQRELLAQSDMDRFRSVVDGAAPSAQSLGSYYDRPSATTAESVPAPQTVSDYLDAARRAYDEGRLADAEQSLTRALSLIRQQSPPPVPPAGIAVRVGDDVAEPRNIRKVSPVYPAEARAAGLSGYVLIEATIGIDGAVREAHVTKSNPAFDQAALDAVSQWAYTPTRLNGVPVEVIMTVNITFTLQ